VKIGHFLPEKNFQGEGEKDAFHCLEEERKNSMPKNKEALLSPHKKTDKGISIEGSPGKAN